MNSNWEKWVISLATLLQGLVGVLTLGRYRPTWSNDLHMLYSANAAKRWQDNRAKNLNVCKVCGSSTYSDRQWHRQYCVNAPHGQMVASALQYQKNEAAFAIREKRLKEQLVLWQGKFNLVRHENNKLRKKLK